MTAYHGTSAAAATAIVGPPSNVDVSLGGGELGRGFYLGKSPSLASSWAHGRYGVNNGAVIQFVIDNNDYVGLHIIVVVNHSEVVRMSNRLRSRGIERTFTFNVDVVEGPIVCNHRATQYKFESQNAQNVLNLSTKMILS